MKMQVSTDDVEEVLPATPAGAASYRRMSRSSQGRAGTCRIGRSM